MSLLAIVASFGVSIVILAAFSFLPLIIFEKDNQSDYPESKS